MRQLSLGGFLDRYIRELSGFERIDIAEMARCADSINPRLKEPLVVYTSIKRPAETVRKLFTNTSLLEEYEKFFAAPDYSEEFFNGLPDNYQKLYHSYLSVSSEKDTEKQLKSLYRDKILNLKTICNITNYRICKNFGINHGNLHAFLYQGKTENISLPKIRAIYDFLSESK